MREEADVLGVPLGVAALRPAGVRGDLEDAEVFVEDQDAAVAPELLLVEKASSAYLRSAGAAAAAA